MPPMRSSDLIYKLDDVPPWNHLLALSVQQMLFMFAASTFPAMLVREIGGSVELATAMVSLTMIAAGVGSVIQASRLPFMGSGYLCPNVCGPSYLGASLHAAWVGGLPVMRGMILFSGLVEMALAPIIKRVRGLFPNLVVGLVVMMVGVSVITVSISNFFGVAYAGDEIRWQDVLIGSVSLLIMIFANLWGKGWVRMYCLLLGTLAGWLLAFFITRETWEAFSIVKGKALFDLPTRDLSMFTLGFDPSLAVTFLIVSICGSLKSFGNLLAAQQISEPEKREPDMKPLARGLMADGFTTAMAGVMGALAVDTSSSNVGLAAATRAVSRRIAIVAGVLFTILAFMPKITSAIATIPRPVLGASILFAGAFMICTGIQQMVEDGMDTKGIFTVGISMFFGFSTGFMPHLYARLPFAAQQFFTDPLATTTIFAVVLYQVFNLDRLWKKNSKSRPGGSASPGKK